MRVRDRRWWLRALWAICLLVSSALFAVWYFQHILPLDHALAIPAYRDAILAAVICFMLIVLTIYTALGALTARHRYHARLAAIHGDHNAIPISRLADELASHPNLPESLPFIATNRTARRTTIGTLFGFAFLAALLIGLDVVSQSLAFLLNIIRVNPHTVRISTHASPIPLLLVVIFIGSWPLMMYFVRFQNDLRSLPYLLRRATITSDGITCKPAWGAPRILRWCDARLFEVAYVFEPSRQRNPAPASKHQFTGLLLCTLCGTTNSVFWSQRIGDITASTNQFAPIAALVTLYTDLDPCTFGARLKYPSQLDSTDIVFVRDHILRIASCLAGVVTSATFIGIPRIGWIAVVGGTFMSVLFLLGFYSPKQRKIRREELRAEQMTPLLSPTQSLDESNDDGDESEDEADLEPEQHFDDPLYEMTVGSYPLFVFNQVFFALMGVAAVLFALGILVSTFTPFHPLPALFYLHPLSPMQILCIALLLLAGILTIIVSIRARDTIVLADLTGVRKRWLLGNTFIPWGDVERIEVRFIAGRPTYYRAFGHGGRPAFAWPARPFQPSPKPQEPGATLTNPANMAAIVAQRSGKPLTPGPPRAFPL